MEVAKSGITGTDIVIFSHQVLVAFYQIEQRFTNFEKDDTYRGTRPYLFLSRANLKNVFDVCPTECISL